MNQIIKIATATIGLLTSIVTNNPGSITKNVILVLNAEKILPA